MENAVEQTSKFVFHKIVLRSLLTCHTVLSTLYLWPLFVRTLHGDSILKSWFCILFVMLSYRF